LLLPLPLLIPGTEAACGYCILLMGVYWTTEVLHLAVTALLPLVLFPLWGVLPAGTVSKSYFPDTNWLFVGGLMIATAVESTNLHKRISLRILTIVGANPRCLMFGIMLTTFFLSMLISNTATTAMMLPIVQAVVNKLIGDEDDTGIDKQKTFKEGVTNELLNEMTESFEDVHKVNSTTTVDEKVQITSFVVTETPVDTDDEKEKSLESQVKKNEDDEEWKLNLRKAMTICVPYASSIGGTATINGTGPNTVLAGQFSTLFPDAPDVLSYPNWLIYCLPCALVYVICAYFWVSNFYLGFNLRDMFGCLRPGKKSRREKEANKLLQDEYLKLGPIRWAEVTVLVVFATTVLLWFFRAPGFMPGWDVFFVEDFMDDGTVAIFMALTLFFLPEEKPMFLRGPSEVLPSEMKPISPVIKWNSMVKVFPWGIIFLLGGGYAIAAAATESGLSAWLGEVLSALRGIEPWIIVLIITTVLSLFTEITSNAATASIFVPILAALAENLEINPLYMLIPPVLSTSMAFMLPIATPPNAIAFGYGHLKIMDTVKCGFFLNLLGIFFVNLFINTYGYVYFDLGEFPDWANTTSV